MPPAVPLVAAAAGTAATGAAVFGTTLLGSTLLATVANAAVGFVVSTAVNQLGSRALSKKPTAQAFTAEASGRTVSVRSSVESHKVVYGTARVSGPLAFAATTDSGVDNPGQVRTGPNRFLHLVIPLAGHEVDSVPTVYLNDRAVTADGGGWVFDAPYSRTETKTVQTTVTRAVTSAVRSNNTLVKITTSTPHGFAFGSTVTLAGVGPPGGEAGTTFTVAGEVTATTFTVRSPGGNNGPIPLQSTATASSVVGSPVTTTYSHVRVKAFLGTDSQTASPDLVAEVPGWTTAHRLRGIAYLHVRLEYSADAFPLGVPNVSAVVKGKKVYDPRTGLTYWSENAALCVRDYLSSDYGFACDDTELDDAQVTAAANVCEEATYYQDGGQHLRYACNGVVDTAAAPLDNLQALVTSLAGAVTYVQGKFRVHAAAYETPSGEITPDRMAGPVSVTARPARKELFNAVRGTYVDPARSWQPTDFPPVTNAAYEAEDNGERIPKDVELPFTTHPEAAQRLAKVLLEKGRQGVQATVRLNHSALRYAVWDVVTLTDPAYGWSAKPFRVTGWSLAPPGPVTLTLREESPESYDWDAGEATVGDAAPDTNLPSPFAVQAPGALTVTESLYVTRNGDGVKAKAVLTWVASEDVFLRHYQAEYKGKNAADWLDLPTTTRPTADVEDIAPGDYDFRVKAVTHLGVSSAHSVASKSLSGLLAPPAEPRHLTVATIGGFAFLSWDISEDLDVRIGGKVVFRHSPDGADGWVQSTSVGNAVPGGSTVAVLPLKAGVYLAKAVDSSGTESVLAASVTTDQATALAFANVATLTEDPAFSGTKSNCVESGGRLKLTAGGVISAVPLVSALPSIAYSSGDSPEGTYAFSGGLDFGSVKSVRLTARVRAEMVNQLDSVRSRTALVSEWLSVSGANAASGDARVFVRVTDDDPAGSPTWSDWQRLDSGEFRCRGVDPELRLYSLDPAYNVVVSELSLTADEVA